MCLTQSNTARAHVCFQIWFVFVWLLGSSGVKPVPRDHRRSCACEVFVLCRVVNCACKVVSASFGMRGRLPLLVCTTIYACLCTKGEESAWEFSPGDDNNEVLGSHFTV